jgi:4-hydroxy-tetrahydrodipicolinate reductase
MRVALFGYGKMGRLVETLAVREGWEVSPKLDIDDNAGGSGITSASMAGVDVAMDFSQPDAVLPNIEAAARAGVNLVVGTTGWLEARAGVERTVRESGIGLIYASNFSVGVNLFFEIVAHAGRIIGKVPQYDPYIVEEHHRTKKDAPSGTALNLFELLKPHVKRTSPGIASIRAGFIPGNHAVGYDSESDTIILEHRARGRQGFAEGAILGARWIKGKKGFYDFRDVFREIIGINRIDD